MGLDWFNAELEKLYALRGAARLGPVEGDDKETTVLNRVVRWMPRVSRWRQTTDRPRNY